MRILGDHAVCRGFAPKSGFVFRVNLDLLKILIKLKQNIGIISAVLPYIAVAARMGCGD